MYKIYDFVYINSLTEDFKKQNILVKNLQLLWLVLKKLPLLLIKLFDYKNFNRPYLTFYAFFLFFIISFAIIMLIPASIDLATQFSISKELTKLLNTLHLNSVTEFLKFINLKEIVKTFLVPFTTLVILIIPDSQTLLIKIATEFISVNKYLENGEKSQLILGHLDLLIEFIAEENKDSKIHLHCYSFGSLVAIDLLYPIGNIPSKNVKDRIELLITTGNPYDFINAYYPKYFIDRNYVKSPKINWINIYSISDALATNFRKKQTVGKAEYSLPDYNLLPENLNYEIAPRLKHNLFNFFTMHGIRVHKKYWDTTPNGQSCMRLIVDKMMEQNFINF